MISVNDAIKIIDTNCKALLTHKVDTVASLGYTLSKSIISDLNFPPFDQSAMDGYALNFKEGANKYKIIGEVKAGDQDLNLKIKPGQGVRIFTGAKIPSDCTTVIQQEWCIKNKTEIKFTQKPINKINIRKKGEQIQKGNKALQKGVNISPGLIGYLTGLGVEKVDVVMKPKIGIVITGNELTELGEKLEEGKIYESNSYMLIAALKKYHYDSINLYRTIDDYEQTKNKINSAIIENDVVLISGGISVGEYDFVEKSLINLNVKKHFHKVNQKPGKPLFYGSIGDKHIFGLPGNPGAALTCFYIYVLRLLSVLSAVKYPIKIKRVNLNYNYKKKSGRSEFLKVELKDNVAHICDFQNSSMLRAFENANALVYIDEKVEIINPSQDLDAYLLL